MKPFTPDEVSALAAAGMSLTEAAGALGMSKGALSKQLARRGLAISFRDGRTGRPKKACSVEGCCERHFGKGWCHKHYNRWRAHGDPLALVVAEPGAPLEFIKQLPAEGQGCVTWPFAKSSNGRARVSVCGRMEQAPRVVCALFHGPAPSPDHQAAHSCGNGHKACVSPWHLRWATRRENEADKADHGTLPRGERAPWAKLTEDAVRRIADDPRRHREIAAEFGIARSTVGGIKRRRGWAHLWQ